MLAFVAGNFLVGTLPSEISLLSNLKSLQLRKYTYEGQRKYKVITLSVLPVSLSHYLKAEDNFLQGTIPEEISTLGGSMKELNLGKS